MQKLRTVLYVLIEVVTQICERALNIFYTPEMLVASCINPTFRLTLNQGKS